MIKEIIIVTLAVFILGLMFAPKIFNPIKQQAITTTKQTGETALQKGEKALLQQLQGNLTCIQNGEQTPCHYKDKNTVIIGG